MLNKGIFPTFAAVFVITVFFRNNLVVGQEAIESYKVKVTYYDYYDDRSNPDFLTEKSYGCCDVGVVEPILGPDKKPKKIESAPKYPNMTNLELWFKPWDGKPASWSIPAETLVTLVIDSSAPPETSISFWGVPTIEYPKSIDTVYYPERILTSDTAFKNVTIEDSLLFEKKPYFELKSKGLDSTGRIMWDTTWISGYWIAGKKFPYWWPLNGRGLPYNDSCTSCLPYLSNNGCFTMELHNKVKYNGGEILRLSSDDDAWLFINNRLVIDLGGGHPALEDTIYFDSIAPIIGMEKGGIYDFDLFYAERFGHGAELYIMTTAELVETSKKTGGQNTDQQNTSNQSSPETNQPRKKGICGSGWLLAFIPIFIKPCCMFRRWRKKKDRKLR